MSSNLIDLSSQDKNKLANRVKKFNNSQDIIELAPGTTASEYTTADNGTTVTLSHKDGNHSITYTSGAKPNIQEDLR